MGGGGAGTSGGNGGVDMPYEKEPECSFCSSSVEPILERFNDGFNIK